MGRGSTLNVLNKTLGNQTGIICLHSSLAYINQSGERNVYDILAWLRQISLNGWTVALPSFTFSFCKEKKINLQKSPSEAGVLADLVLNHLDSALRTPDPIYSHVVIGPRAAEPCKLEPKSALGQNSIFEWFEKNNAQIIMLGCGWDYCTFFHRFEETMQVDYRNYKSFEGELDDGYRKKPIHRLMFVRDIDLNPINDFSPAVAELEANNLISRTKFWDGEIETAYANDIQFACEKLLRKDPMTFVKNAAEVRKRQRDKKEREKQDPIVFSVISHQNVGLIENEFEVWLEKAMPDRSFSCFSIPFGQASSFLFDKTNTFWQSPPKIRVCIDSLEAIAGADWLNPVIAAKSVKDFYEIVRLYHDTVGGWTILNSFTLTQAMINPSQHHVAIETLKVANETLFEIFSGAKQIVWVNPAIEYANFPHEVFDRRLLAIGKFPFSQVFSSSIAKKWAGLSTSILGKSTRLVILDLDNTIWSGVIGEDGLAGIKIGGDYPGNVFKELQEFFLELHNSGITLAICSKNDEDLALQAFDELPEMVLKRKHFASWRINWRPKWQNIQEICDELNLGLQSALFVDDNPVEREKAQLNLPDLKVADMPADPIDYLSELRTNLYLNIASISNEDLSRSRNFAAQKERESSLKRALNLEDYYKSLKTKVYINPLNDGNAQRAEQLCNKTNQFNTTTKRFDQKDLFLLLEKGHDVAVIGLEDRFSSFENIGVIILNGDGTNLNIELFLLSCRVLGRGMETSIPIWASGRAKDLDYSTIIGKIVDSDRNTPARDIYQRSGFTEFGPNLWKKEAGCCTQPEWIELIDNYKRN